MKWLLLAVGLVVGFVGGAVAILYLQQGKAPDEMSIVFAQKSYFENEGAVLVSGTMTGPGLAYPNNTYAIGCYREHKECWLTYVQAIGGLLMRRTRSIFGSGAIAKWSPGMSRPMDATRRR
jgi:hypothetical protein